MSREPRYIRPLPSLDRLVTASKLVAVHGEHARRIRGDLRQTVVTDAQDPQGAGIRLHQGLGTGGQIAGGRQMDPAARLDNEIALPQATGRADAGSRRKN